jgi:hypothetical protein
VIGAVLVMLGFTPAVALARGGGNWPRLDPRGHVLPPRVDSGSDRSAKMQGHDMMQACQMHCQATATTLETLRTRLQAAQASNDLAHMHAILDDVRRLLAAMQDAMAGCLDMMCMVPQGYSGMGRHGQGQ